MKDIKLEFVANVEFIPSINREQKYICTFLHLYILEECIMVCINEDIKTLMQTRTHLSVFQ